MTPDIYSTCWRYSHTGTAKAAAKEAPSYQCPSRSQPVPSTSGPPRTAPARGHSSVHDVLGTSLNTGDHACPSSHVSGRATPHACPPVPTGDRASCDHTATTDSDHPAPSAAPDDSRRRHRQHRLSPLGCLDSSGATGEVRSDEADGMTALPPWHAARLTVLLDALGGVPISDAERRSLVWLAGFERTPWRTLLRWSPASGRPR
jgi:hypothetical protein